METLEFLLAKTEAESEVGSQMGSAKGWDGPPHRAAGARGRDTATRAGSLSDGLSPRHALQREVGEVLGIPIYGSFVWAEICLKPQIWVTRSGLSSEQAGRASRQHRVGRPAATGVPGAGSLPGGGNAVWGLPVQSRPADRGCCTHESESCPEPLLGLGWPGVPQGCCLRVRSGCGCCWLRARVCQL